MKSNTHFLFFSFVCLFLMPGCGRLIDWGKQEVEQGTDLEKDVKVAKDHVRSSRVYDQFTLLGAFDSLWLSDEVRDVYAHLYSLKHGRTQEEKKIFLRRQLEENNHFISFYLLSSADIVIGEKDSDWTILLQIDDYNFVPTEFKTVDLSPEHKSMFGKHFNKFKTAYILQFNAKDVEDISLIQSTTKEISLVFRTVDKEVLHTWDLDSSGRLLV